MERPPPWGDLMNQHSVSPYMEVTSCCVLDFYKSCGFGYLWYLLNSNKGDMSTVGRGDCYGRGRGYQSPHHRSRTCDTFPAPGILCTSGKALGSLQLLRSSLEPATWTSDCFLLWAMELHMGLWERNSKRLWNVQQSKIHLKSHVRWTPGDCGRAWLNYIIWSYCGFGFGYTVCSFSWFSSKDLTMQKKKKKISPTIILQ